MHFCALRRRCSPLPLGLRSALRRVFRSSFRLRISSAYFTRAANEHARLYFCARRLYRGCHRDRLPLVQHGARGIRLRLTRNLRTYLRRPGSSTETSVFGVAIAALQEAALMRRMRPNRPRAWPTESCKVLSSPSEKARKRVFTRVLSSKWLRVLDSRRFGRSTEEDRPDGTVFFLIGSRCWTRTSDPLINSQLLYQLS